MKKSELISLIKEVIKEHSLVEFEQDLTHNKIDSEEKEVTIAKRMLRILDSAEKRVTGVSREDADRLYILALEILKMHGENYYK